MMTQVPCDQVTLATILNLWEDIDGLSLALYEQAVLEALSHGYANVFSNLTNSIETLAHGTQPSTSLPPIFWEQALSNALRHMWKHKLITIDGVRWRHGVIFDGSFRITAAGQQRLSKLKAAQLPQEA